MVWDLSFCFELASSGTSFCSPANKEIPTSLAGSPALAGPMGHRQDSSRPNRVWFNFALLGGRVISGGGSGEEEGRGADPSTAQTWQTTLVRRRELQTKLESPDSSLLLPRRLPKF